MSIEIDTETGKPTTDQGRKHFLRTIRYIVRSGAPMIGKIYWSDIEEDERSPLIAHIMSCFNIKDVEQYHVQGVIDRYFSEAYKRVRKDYFGHFCAISDCGIDPELHPPEGVKPDDWAYLCFCFGSPEFKHRSEVNEKNREKLADTHCMGPKFFLVVLSVKNLDPIELNCFDIHELALRMAIC